MITPAQVELQSPRHALLKSDGKQLQLQIMGLENVNWKEFSTAPRTKFDGPNPGTSIIGFDVSLKGNEAMRYRVVLTPGHRASLSEQAAEFKPLQEWQ